MILIDSLYINNSGGLRLLEYLIEKLIKRGIDFYLLADSRCMNKFDDCKHVRYMKASLLERKKFYQIKKNSFSSVLCFGNIPAPIILDIPVFTYFHNINLLTLSESRNIKEKMIMWMKRQFFRNYKHNTDFWLVQTSNTAKELIHHLNEKSERVKLIPFYELPDELCKLKNEEHGNDYVYISNYTGAKGHEELLEAWRLLHHKGIDKTLHFTIPKEAQSFITMIKQAQNEGVNVINHGLVPFEKVIYLYRQSKAIIYPSHNESLGLGIVEAITAGCDVIGSDLPFIHAICKPSGTFNPYSPESIANAIEEYEKGGIHQSELLIHNQIDELIELINKKKDN